MAQQPVDETLKEVLELLQSIDVDELERLEDDDMEEFNLNLHQLTMSVHRIQREIQGSKAREEAIDSLNRTYIRSKKETSEPLNKLFNDEK